MESESRKERGLEYYFYDRVDEYFTEARTYFHIIVGGNFNDDHREGSRMTKWMIIMFILNITSPPDEENPATFRGGKRTIYHILVTEGLLETVILFRYLPYNLGFDSDHR